MRNTLWACLLALAWATAASADPGTADAAIGVGEPRYYSELTLRRMLDSVAGRLEAAEATMTYATSERVGQFQGTRERTTVNVFNLEYRPLETTVATSTATRKETRGAEEQIQRPEEYTQVLSRATTTTHTAPAPVAPPPRPGSPAADKPNAAAAWLKPTFEGHSGLNAIQALRERTQLTFEFLNLRYLLAPSYWDRRSQERVTVGIDISVQPRGQHEGAVAQVVLRLPRSPGSSGPRSKEDEISLIHLFPRKETYNVVSVQQDVSGLGLGALLGPVAFGSNSQETSTAGYLVQDVDTVAMNLETPRHVQFGWQFRPVLGREAVEPGVRRVYAVLALPRKLLRKQAETTLEFEVKTRWVSVDTETGALYGVRDESPWFRRRITLADPVLALPELLNHVQVGSEIIDVGVEGKKLVVVYGVNFSPDMDVYLGNDHIARSDLTFGIGTKQSLFPEVAWTSARSGGTKGPREVSASPAAQNIDAFLQQNAQPPESGGAPKGARSGRPSAEPMLETLSFLAPDDALKPENLLTVGNDFGTRSWSLLEIFGSEAAWP